MRDTLDMTTLIFAALAIFVLWKLWSVLGARTGNEKPPFNPFAKLGGKPGAVEGPPNVGSNVVQLPGAVAPANRVQNDNGGDRWKGFAEPGSKIWAGLDDIAQADTKFVVSPFLEGAKKAYEMIVLAFAAGDRKTLKNLLSNDVYDSFALAISAREERGEKVETTFVSLEKALIDEAQYKIPLAQMTIRFFAKLISVTRASDGSIVDGSADKIVDMVDVWTFSRDVSASDPNWKLIATETGH